MRGRGRETILALRGSKVLALADIDNSSLSIHRYRYFVLRIQNNYVLCSMHASTILHVEFFCQVENSDDK